jgi:hypothetical protein
VAKFSRNGREVHEAHGKVAAAEQAAADAQRNYERRAAASSLFVRGRSDANLRRKNPRNNLPGMVVVFVFA